MASTKRLFKSFSRLFLPIVVLLALGGAAAAVWLVQNSATPQKTSYLVTPQKYGLLSTRGATITDESWTNRDGTAARGWLLRGNEGAPAVVLLHRYGADRSWVLNLGVKLNEATNFTVLMPDARGHGENPQVKWSSFGGCEAEDATAALEYLRGLKTENKNALVGANVGVYGVEMGAQAAIIAASKDANVKALVLDSVPQKSGDVLASVVRKRFPFASFVTSRIAEGGTYLYFYDGCYNRDSLCAAAKSVGDRRVMLLAGVDAPELQASTSSLNACFPNSTNVESKTDLTPSGYNFVNASLEQSEIYDQRVIDFFSRSLNGE